MGKLDNDKAVEATATFLRRRGYDVLDVMAGNEVVKIVAHDDESDDTVFVSVQAREGASADEPARPERAKYEAEACEWLADHRESLGGLRFDAVMLTVVGDQNALLRHHINCLQAAL